MRLQREMQRRHYPPHTTSTPTTQRIGGQGGNYTHHHRLGWAEYPYPAPRYLNSQLLRRTGETIKFDGGERVDVDDAGVGEMEV
jgi:hypothetical protein